MLGKARRLSRLFVGEKQRCLLSPLDHGGWLGPVKGLDRPQAIVEQVIAGGANAILASPGFLRAAALALTPATGLVLRVSLTAGLSAQGTQETPIAQLDTALRLDADAVAVSVFFGREGDLEIYRWLAELIRTCEPYAMQVVAEMMPPGDRDFDATAEAAQASLEAQRVRRALATLTDADLSHAGLPYRGARRLLLAGVEVLLVRVTYAGELGYEIYLPVSDALPVWDAIVLAGHDFGLALYGLKALASLRLEEGYRGYGHDLGNTHGAADDAAVRKCRLERRLRGRRIRRCSGRWAIRRPTRWTRTRRWPSIRSRASSP